MKTIVQVTVGTTTYRHEVEEKNTMATLHEAIVIGNPKFYCNECKNTGNQNFQLDSNKDKEGNIYVNNICRKCGAKSKLGQYKAGGYFWHKFEVYKKEGQGSTGADSGEGYPTDE